MSDENIPQFINACIIIKNKYECQIKKRVAVIIPSVI